MKTKMGVTQEGGSRDEKILGGESSEGSSSTVIERLLDKIIYALALPAINNLIKFVAIIVISSIGFATILALVIADLHEPEVVLLVMGFSGFMITFIWHILSKNLKAQELIRSHFISETQEQMSELQKSISELRERIENVEIIESFENRLAGKERQKLIDPDCDEVSQASGSLVNE